MFSVLTQPRFRHRQPVAGVMPNDSRNLSNKIIGLAASGSREIPSGFLWMFPNTFFRVAHNRPDSQSPFLLFFAGRVRDDNLLIGTDSEPTKVRRSSESGSVPQPNEL